MDALPQGRTLRGRWGLSSPGKDTLLEPSAAARGRTPAGMRDAPGRRSLDAPRGARDRVALPPTRTRGAPPAPRGPRVVRGLRLAARRAGWRLSTDGRCLKKKQERPSMPVAGEVRRGGAGGEGSGAARGSRTACGCTQRRGAAAERGRSGEGKEIGCLYILGVFNGPVGLIYFYESICYNVFWVFGNQGLKRC